MTHTLHRVERKEKPFDVERDIIFLSMPSNNINHEGSGPKLRKFLELSLECGAIHLGDARLGNEWWQGSREAMLNNIEDRAVVQAVFNDKDKALDFLKVLKKEDLGLSVVVSGIFETTKECCKQAGLEPHTENRSLKIWGRTEELPSEEILGITTMCGHAMVPVQLVEDMVKRIKKGRITPEEAGNELSKPCMCGIFNPERAAEILKTLAETT